ncbi:MAG: nucleoside kinase [Firmicutes bacterium]|nr:nucleoside kinase [Bacillota bacterium]
MDLKIRTSPKGKWTDITLDKPANLEEIIHIYKDKTGERPPYIYLCAIVNNSLRELDFIIDKDCNIEFLDMRSGIAKRLYQNSLLLIYMKAVKDIYGPVDVNVEYSLNKGLYTEVSADHELTEKEVNGIVDRMHQIVDADIPLKKEVIGRDEVITWLKEQGMTEKLRLLEKRPDVKNVQFYSIEDCRNLFYGLMVPSTGYIRYFSLMKYKNGILVRYPSEKNPNEVGPYIEQSMLYYAYVESKKWHKLMEVSYVEDLNEMVRSGEYNELIQLSEALHEKKISDIADMIHRQHKRIVLIAGPSSSGKTTFARRLCIQLRVNGLKPLYLGTDDYFVERSESPRDEHGEYNYEDLDALDIGLFNSNMNDLLAGKEVDMPRFDFMTGTKVFGERITSISKNQPIVIEGIHGLNEKLTPEISRDEKFKIYISPFINLNIDKHNRVPASDVRMLRRMVRDYNYRGHSPEATINSWSKVRRGEEKNIFPFIDESNVVFNSAHLYEVAVLKKYVESLLRNIGKDKEEHATAVSILRILEFFETIEDDSIIANNSILREFIGGSVILGD